MHDLCDLEALKNVVHNTPVAPEEFITHTSNMMLISGPVTGTAAHPMRESTVPHQLLLLQSSTGLPSGSLKHIRKETTDGIHAQARRSTM
jgi:hypothetical protein